ncbi:MAG: hypothetical protein AAGE94_10830 [Acidobacteriota bacterium]
MEDLGARSTSATIVRPRHVWRETLVIALLIANLGLVVAMRAHALRDRPRTGLGPFEVAIGTLPDVVRTAARTLEAAAGDVVVPVRTGGGWPDVETLAADWVPPFASRLLPPELRSLQFAVADQAPAWIDFAGRPSAADTDLGAFVLRIVDRDAEVDPFRHPHPHEPRRSPDDPRFEVQVWHHDDEAAPYPGVDLRPIGWRHVIDGGDA